MVLSERQLREYRTTGYAVVRGFFTSREVEAFRRELDRFVHHGLLRNVTTSGDGITQSTTQINLQIVPVFPHSPLYRAAPFQPRVVEAITQILGEPVIVHLDQIFLKPAHHGRGTDWHQDNHYFKIADPMMGCGMWTALHDATIANGTMHVAPGMWNRPLPHTRDPYSDHHLHCAIPPERAVPIEMSAGSVLFFSYGTPHCTKANTTDQDRAGLAMHFLRADYAPPELLRPERRERPYINGLQCTGGSGEYGFKVQGTWDEEVEEVLGKKNQT